MEAGAPMNIVFIGSPYVNSTSRGIASVITKSEKVRNSGFMDSFQFARKYCEAYSNKNVDKLYYDREPIPLSFFYKLAPPVKQLVFNVIFVEQNGFDFYNDIDLPVIYYHRDIPTPPFMNDPDIFLYRFKAMERSIPKQCPELWNNGIYKKRFLNAVAMDQFEHNLPKIYEGVNWVGWQKPLEYHLTIPTDREYYQWVKKILDYCRKKFLINYHPHGIHYTEAKRILQQSEAVLIVPGNEAYVTRKIYEAAVAKTLIVLWVQNEEGFQIFTEIGLKHKENCIMWRKLPELEKICLDLYDYPMDEIINNAYNWVKNNHTWDNRAHELLRILEENGIE